MDNMEFNKVFAALLIAGIVAYLGGFMAKQFIHPAALDSDAVAIEGIDGGAASGPSKPQGPEPILAMIADADIAYGERLSRACAACHSFNNGGPHGTGPNIWDKINAPVASKAGYTYSNPMKEHGGTWTYSELNHFLWKPTTYIKGTKMNFIGLKKPEDRAAVIAWMRSLSDSPAALPTDAEISAEIAELAPEQLETEPATTDEPEITEHPADESAAEPEAMPESATESTSESATEEPDNQDEAETPAE